MADDKTPKLYPLMVNADERRERIREGIMQGVELAFPMQGKHYDLRLESFEVDRKLYSPNEQKQALLEKKTLTEPIKGTLALVDKATGEVIERKKKTLAHMPYFTERHTFILKGNEYAVSNQVRIKPGVYTRERGNGELEAAFNLAKGKNFRLSMDGEKGILRMEYATTRIPLYPVLTSLGVTHAAIASAWGKDLADVNRDYVQGKEAAAVTQLYTKIVSPYAQKKDATLQEKIDAIKASYSSTRLDPNVTRVTLGSEYSSVEPATLLAASRKIINVYNAKEEADDRDSLAFKTLHTVESFMKERIIKHATKDVVRKATRNLNKPLNDPKIDTFLSNSPFSKSLTSFLTSSALANTPMQINPMEILDSSVKVTSLGEGGISSTLAVPDEARDVHGSHLGMLDFVRTPESGKAGIDIRATIHLARDDEGNMYTPMYNERTGKAEFIAADKLVQSNIAFHGQRDRVKADKSVDVLTNGRVRSVRGKDVDYSVPYAASMYSPATNLVPMLDSAMGNRNIMGAKFQTQALPLVEREQPYVQVKAWNKDTSVESELAKMISPHAPVSGTVEKIDDNYIYIRKDRSKTASVPAREFASVRTPVYIASHNETKTASEVQTAVNAKGAIRRNNADDDIVRVPYSTNFPLTSKTFVHDTLKVKAGDKVQSGQPIGDNNFTRDGALALGKNMRVAYMAYKGYNSNDALVISESAQRKLTSEHMYKESLTIDKGITLHRDKHKAYFGTKYSRAEYDQLDERGVIKKGAIVNDGDLLIAALRESQPNAHAQMLGKLHKSLVKPFNDAGVTWSHHAKGEVIDVAVTSGSVLITVRCEAPIEIGDKLANRFGAKGVVSKIVPDAQMIQDEQGRPIDILITSASINSRVNPNQVIETALAKVVEKTGKPIVLPQQEGFDNVQFAKDLLKKHGVRDKETVYDPETQRKIPGIMVGPQYTFKMFKSTDTNYAARGVGPGYDANLQPSRGGESGAKSIGKMEFNALIAHNARSLLNEVASVKSQNNDEYWRRLQLGLPAVPPNDNFAYNKFQSMLSGAGIKMRKNGTELSLAPLTDRDIDAMAQGIIENANLTKTRTGKGAAFVEPEVGGLFDPATTGGLSGTKYAKIELAEPVVNPIFEEPARLLLGHSKAEFTKLRNTNGAAELKSRLNNIDLDAEERALRESVRTTKGSSRNVAIKKIKYIQALKKEGLKAGDAYVLSKVPVTPPIMRPLSPNPDGTTLVADANYLYRDLMLANEVVKETPQELLDAEGLQAQRAHLHDAVGALFGTNDAVSPQNQGRGVKGHLTQITGDGSPKYGFFQSRLLKRRQDLSARATIAPDHTLGMDEVGMPEAMAWETYSPFIIKRLIQQGSTAIDARNAVKAKSPAARRALDVEIQKRPVYFNRAPTLHRYNVIAAYPKLIGGKTIHMSPFAEAGMNADYDGDAVQLHVPVSDAAIRDANSMTLSNLIFADRSKDSLMVFPAHEAIIGNYMATSRNAGGAVRKFKTMAEAKAAYNRNEINMDTPVEIEELK